jgi:hypothetical protein
MGEAAKRLVNVLVAILATAAFFALPVGGKTLAAHTVSILATPPAREAGRAIASAVMQAQGEVEAMWEPSRGAASARGSASPPPATAAVSARPPSDDAPARSASRRR